MSRYYLIHERIHPLCIDKWYMMERGIDFKRISPKDCKSKGMIEITKSVVYEADTLPQMLHKIQDNMDWRFYVVTGFINSKGEMRHEKFENHRHICSLSSFIKEVCDIREQEGKLYNGELWCLDYCRELWAAPGGYGGNTLYRVEGFTEKMERAVREYMDEHGLKMGMEDVEDERI